MTIEGYSIYYERTGNRDLPIIVCLHGFTGSTATWKDLAARLKNDAQVITIDLMGHGQTDSPETIEAYTMDRQLLILEALFDHLQITSFTLLGYSMGGRIALSYALAYPQRVNRLLLESASPGLKLAEERAARRKNDALLAERIEREGMANFVGFWENIPLFASQKRLPEAVQQQIRLERQSQGPEGLANSLKGIGTGSQPSNWDKLSTLTLPVLLITGALDKKFVLISREMKKQLPNSKQIIVEDVGHAIHVENPSLFATIVKKYIN